MGKISMIYGRRPSPCPFLSLLLRSACEWWVCPDLTVADPYIAALRGRCDIVGDGIWFLGTVGHPHSYCAERSSADRVWEGESG